MLPILPSIPMELKIWDPIGGGQALRTIDGHERDIYAIAYSPDDLLIATGGWDNDVNIWDAATGNIPLLSTNADETSTVNVSINKL